MGVTVCQDCQEINIGASNNPLKTLNTIDNRLYTCPKTVDLTNWVTHGSKHDSYELRRNSAGCTDDNGIEDPEECALAVHELATPRPVVRVKWSGYPLRCIFDHNKRRGYWNDGGKPFDYGNAKHHISSVCKNGQQFLVEQRIGLRKAEVKKKRNVLDKGCWKDSHHRALHMHHGHGRDYDDCYEKATERNHKYFGLQAGSHCFTSNNPYWKYGRHVGECALGGHTWVNHVFEIERIPKYNIVSAKLSSTHAHYSAAKCIDGDTSTFCHSGNQQNPWLQLDLGSIKHVTMVRIFNRVDCCMERLNDHSIYLGNNPNNPLSNALCNQETVTAKIGPYEESCNGRGRYVYIRQNKHTILNLGEIEIYGPANNGWHQNVNMKCCRSGGPIDFGCWKDGPNRAMSKYWGSGFNKDMCYKRALEINHQYFAMQAGSHCFTGNEYDKYGKITGKCPENGGPFINHVFEVPP
jgi:hypothetical protein